MKSQTQKVHRTVLTLIPKAQATKEIDKLDLFKIINFGDAKEIINKKTGHLMGEDVM